MKVLDHVMPREKRCGALDVHIRGEEEEEEVREGREGKGGREGERNGEGRKERRYVCMRVNERKILSLELFANTEMGAWVNRQMVTG